MRFRLALVLAISTGLGCGGHAATPVAAEPVNRPAPRAQVASLDATAPETESETARGTESEPAPVPESEAARSPQTGAARSPKTRTHVARETIDAVPAVRLDRPRTDQPRDEVVHHTLRRGQTLYSVARTYAIPLDALMKANGITNPRKVAAGTRLIVPGVRRAVSDSPRPPAPADATHDVRGTDDPAEHRDGEDAIDPLPSARPSTRPSAHPPSAE